MADRDWRVTLEYVNPSDGRIMDTTFCIRDHTSVPEADPLSGATVASDLASWLSTSARGMADTSLTLSRVHVNTGGPFGPDAGSDPLSGDSEVNLAGTLAAGTGDALPHGLCARATLYTDLASRRGRGRLHAPWGRYSGFLSGADTWNNGGTYLNALRTFMNTLTAGHDVTHDAVSHHYSLRVHSRQDNATRDVVSYIARQQVSYLRSRLTAP